MMVMGLMFATTTYAEMQILIEMQTGETFTLEVDNSYVYVAQIKGMIQTGKGISPDQQRLIYNGVFLEESKMLGEYGITEDGTTIRLVLRCCGTGIDNIFHDVTHGTLDYYTTYTDGKLSDQLASGSVAAGTTVYVKAASDFGFTVKDMSIKAVESYASGDAEAPSLRAPSLGTTVTLTKVSDGLYSFTMPANGNDVNITASLPAKAKNTDAISYIDFDGVTQTAAAGSVYILDGTEEVLGSHEYDPNTHQPYMTWYVCNTPATENDGKGLCYNSKLTAEGRVNLILADGCKMTVNASESNSGALLAIDPLTILGQTNGTGALNVSSENANGIHASNLFIAGGHVTAHSTNGDGIHCGEIIIYDGVVSASSDTNDGIDAYQSSVYIHGGQVTATGGTNTDAVGIRLSGLDTYVALSWRKPTDFIQANSYDLLTSTSRIYIEDNLVMQYTDDAGIHKICGVISKDDNGTPYNQYDDFYSIAGKKLTPYGYGGYCGRLEALNELMWEIPLNANATSATDLSTTMTVEGKGTMTCNNPDSAPWNNNEKYPYTSVNVKATGFLTLQDITVNTPVTLHFLGDIPSDCQERYVVTIWNGESYEPVELTQSNGVYTFQVPACGYAYIEPAIAISFADGETWRTWCDHNTWKLPHGIEIYSIYGMSANGQITLISVNDPENPNGPVIPAGTPLLLQKTGDDLVAIYDSDAASNSLVYSSEVPIGDTDMSATLWGNPTNTAITEGYFTENGLTAYNFYRGAFVRVENNQEVGAHHCLLTTSSAIAPQSLAISGLTGSSNQFGHITYTGTATNDGGVLTFYKSKKNAEQGENAITLTNGQSTGPTGLDPMYKDPENDDFTIIGYRFFIMATPAVGRRLPAPAVDGTVSFIKAEVVTTNNSVQHAPRRSAPTLEVGQTLPVKFCGYYSGEDDNTSTTDYYGLYYVVMPADENLSVSITATFPEVATNATAIDYVDADGETQSKAIGTAYVLDGTEARLGYGSYNNRTEHETWYVLNKDLTYTNGLELYGKVHLILADGKTMSYDGTERFIYGCGTLDIYGQGGETEGAISAKTTAESCINVYGNLTINGGIVSAESTHETTISCYGIRVNTLAINRGIVSGKSKKDGISGRTITINGGTVSGTGSDSGIYCTAIPTGVLLITGGHVCGVGDKYGIAARGDINITGGQIEATGGTDEHYAGMQSEDGNIILGWTNPTDYIKASSYKCDKEGKAVKMATGQRLVAFNAATGTAASTIVSGTVNDVTPLADRTLRPLDGNYVSINSGNFAFNESTNTTTSPFTITTGEGENATTTHYYIYKKDDTATLSYTGSGFVQVTGLPEGYAAVENQPLQRQFTMAASDVALTATAVTDLTATAVTYDGTARTPEIKQGDDVFDAANYTIAYQLGENAVTAAEVKNANTYTCTMTGLGQYIGITTVPFAITLRSTSLAVEIVGPEATEFIF